MQTVYLKSVDTEWLEIKRCKNVYDMNADHKKAGVAMLISGKTDFKPGSIIVYYCYFFMISFLIAVMKLHGFFNFFFHLLLVGG